MKKKSSSSKKQNPNYFFPQNQPIIISHRGLCNILPQNTIQSIEAAIYKSNLVEFDIMLTSDKQIVVFHDRYLSSLTDIQSKIQFADRRVSTDYQEKDGHPQMKTDWWVNHFSLAQLQKLTVRQAFAERPHFEGLHFKISTLDDILTRIMHVKQTTQKQNECGFLIEVKDLQSYRNSSWDDILIDKLVECLRKFKLDTISNCKQLRFPIIIQSFNHKIMQKINQTTLNLPLMHLYDSHSIINDSFLDDHLFNKSIGIGITKQHATQQIMALCKRRGLSVFYWTVRDDQPDKVPFNFKQYKCAYDYLFELGINGIITEFPQNCHQYYELYKLSRQHQY